MTNFNIHRRCAVCDGSQLFESLKFERTGAGEVRSWIVPDYRIQGYPGIVHGGMLATLHDAAMTHYLFYENITAVTIDLAIHYHHPVRLDRPVAIHAKLDRQRHGLYWLSSEIMQDNTLLCTASSKFRRVKQWQIDDNQSTSPGR